MAGFVRAVIFGAAGPTGFHLAGELAGRGIAVRAAGRRRDRLDAAFAGHAVETMAADALEPGDVARAVEGCDLVVDCIGLPPDRMEDHPRAARHLADAVARTGARCVLVASCWSYLPVRRLPVDETHPREGGVAYARLRREAEDILRAAGAAVVNLPDFYGPRVHTGTLQQALADAAAGRSMNWIGRADTPREYVFVPDAMRTVAALAQRGEAYGERWIVPGAGPLTANDAARIAGEHLGEAVGVRGGRALTLRLVSLFVKPLRAFLPMVPHYVEPVAYDGRKLETLLGPQDVTPYADGIRATLDWLRAQADGTR